MSRFRPGESGNPAGRPPGRGAAATLRQAIEAAAPEVLEVVLRAARAGDLVAARLVLDRIVPPLRPVDLPAPVPVAPGADLATQVRAVVGAALTGELAPDAAATLLSGIGAASRVIEVQELHDRIAALERALKAQQSTETTA